MKNLIYILILSLGVIFVYSCEKENNFKDQMDQELEMRKLGNGNNTVAMCHFDAYTGEYHTIYINENAVEAHLAHDDYKGECTDCDPDCLFCGYLEYFDFDEPSECLGDDDDDGNYKNGDYYCTYYNESEESNPNCEAGEYYSYGWSYLNDRDYYNNEYCGGEDDENDYGTVYANYYYENYCGDEYWWGSVSAYLYDYDLGTYVVDVYDGDNSQEWYELAKYCAGVIDGLAAIAGLENICEEDDRLVNVNVDELKGKKFDKEMIRQMIQDRMPPREGKRNEK